MESWLSILVWGGVASLIHRGPVPSNRCGALWELHLETVDKLHIVSSTGIHWPAMNVLVDPTHAHWTDLP